MLIESKANKIFVTSPLVPDFNNFCQELKEIWSSKVLTNHGPKHALLEESLKNYLRVKEGLSLYNNATTALIIAIKALGLNGEVITTPFTFSATAHVIKWCGLTPVFCDIDEKTMCIDVDKIEKLITKNTSAIMPVHVYGIPCEVKKIQAIAQKYNLKIIYDAAHAFGVEIDGIGIGNFGDMSVFSFHATKLFNTGEGGAIVYNDNSFSERLYLLKNFGIREEEKVLSIGINGKMTEFQALLGIENLKILTKEIDKRKKISDLYWSLLGKINGVELIIPSNANASYQYFPIRINKELFGKSRDDVFQKLRENNIYARKYFYPLCSNYDCYKGLPSSDPDKLPVSNKIAEEILCLPFYGDLQFEDIARICDIILQNS